MNDDLTRSQMGAMASRPNRKLFGLSGPAAPETDSPGGQPDPPRLEEPVAEAPAPRPVAAPARPRRRPAPATKPAPRTPLEKHTLYLPPALLEDVQLAQARWVLENRAWIRANGKPTDSGFITMLLKLGLEGLASGQEGQQHLPVDGRRRR